MTNWNNIKTQIYQEEEALSKKELLFMRFSLIGSKKMVWMIGFFLLGCSISAYVFVQTIQFNTEISTSTSTSTSTSNLKEKVERTISISVEENNGEIGLETSSPVEPQLSDIVVRVDEDLKELEDDKQIEKEYVKQYTVSKEVFQLKKTESTFVNLEFKEFDQLILTIDSLSIMDYPFGNVEHQIISSFWKGLEIRIFSGSTYNFSNLNYSSNSSTHKAYKDVVENAVKPALGVDAGVEFRYPISEIFKVGVGLNYRKIVTQNNYNFEVNEIPVVDSASGLILGYLANGNPITEKLQNTNEYEYLNFPISLILEKSLNKQWSFTAQLTHNTSLLLSQNSYSLNPTYLELAASEDDIFNPIINSCEIRIGLKRKIGPLTYLALEPSYRSYYQSFLNTENREWKPRDIAINLSLILKIENQKTH